jgi:hypothetical protein
MENDPKLIYERMSAIMAEIKSIGKGRQNKAQGYSFRGIDDVYNAVNGALVKHKVFCAPQVINVERSERTSKQGNVLFSSIVTMQYTFFTTDGSSVVMTTVGEGMDSGDKATNKAMSGAQKYAFFQAFCIPTDEIKDSEYDSPEADKPKSAPEGSDTQPEAPHGEEMASDKQRRAIYAIMNDLDIKEEDRKLKCDTVLGLEFGTIKSSKDLTKKQATQIIKALKEEQEGNI